MVTVEAISCPRCGAPVEYQLGNPLTLCLYCETRVVISLGVNQRATAQVDPRPVDMEIRRQLIAALMSQRQRLAQEANALSEQAESVTAQVQEAHRQERVRRSRRFSGIEKPMVMFLGALGASICMVSVIGFLLSSVIGKTLSSIVMAIFFFVLLYFSTRLLDPADRKRQDEWQKEYELKRDRALIPINENLNVVQYRMQLIEKQLQKLQA